MAEKKSKGPSMGKQKSHFRHWMAKKMPKAFFTTSPVLAPPMVDWVLDDVIVTMRQIIVYGQDKKPILAEDFVKWMRMKINARMALCRKGMIINFDKHPFVPIQKGVVQDSRKLNDVMPDEISVPEGCENDPKWIKKIQAHENAKNNVFRILQERKIVKDRGFFIRKGECVPLPWMEATSGRNRGKLVRFMLKSFIEDPELKFLPPANKKLIVDGHYCKSLKEWVEDSDEKRDYFTVPIALTNQHVMEVENATVHCGAFEVILPTMCATVDDSTQLPTVTAEEMFENKLGEFDATFLRHIMVILANNLGNSFTIISIDSDILFISLWFMYKIRNLMPEVLSENIYGFTEEQMNNVIENAKSLQLYVHYAEDAGKYSYVDVNKLYQDLITDFFDGCETNDVLTNEDKEGVIPSLLAVIATRASDYTVGYSYISMETMIETYRLKFDVIGPIVTFPRPRYDIVEIEGHNYQKLILEAYLMQHPKLIEIFKKRKSQFKSDVITLDILRELTKELVTKANRAILEDPSSWNKLYVMDDKKFQYALLNLSKRLPPKHDIRTRCKLLSGYLYMIHMYGNAQVFNLNPEIYGFKKVDPSKPYSLSNITVDTTNDYEGFEEKRRLYLAEKRTKAITYTSHSGSVRVVDITDGDKSVEINKRKKADEDIVLGALKKLRKATSE